jgi:hypothetical protein
VAKPRQEGTGQILLSEAYSKISEGFTTADLKEASAILAKLS